MHEAYAAGIPILAFRNSGNIAYKIENGSVYGRLFENEEDLLSFLRDQVSVFRFLNQNRNRFISTPQMQSVFLQLTQEASPIRPPVEHQDGGPYDPDAKAKPRMNQQS